MKVTLSLCLAAVAVVVCIYSMVVMARKTDDLRAAEAETFKLRGVIVAERRTASDLKRQLASRPELVRAVKEIRSVSPSAKVSSVVVSSTGPLNLAPEPPARPDDPTPVGLCRLVDTDKLELSMSMVRLDTTNGNYVVAGVLSATRERGDLRLAEGELKAELTEASILRPTLDPPKWGFGPMISISKDGLQYGAIVESPPLRILGHEIQAGVTATGNSRVLQGGVFALWR